MSIAICVLIALALTGCYQRQVCIELPNAPGSAPPVADTLTADGRIELGSASLVAGLPGSGPLKIAELERWLADPRQHEVLDVALPAHLGGETPAIPADNPLTRAKIELGRQLFFDPRLSASGAMACGDCHHPAKSYTNFIGVYGELRDPLPAFNRVLGTAHFWDGKAASLEAQVKFPIENKLEMRSSPEAAVQFVSATPGYRLQFEAIFGEVTFDRLAQAIACFERVLVTGASDFDRFRAGEVDAMSAAAERGEALFFGERARCHMCHSGPNFSDEAFHNVGTGREQDQGRFAVTHIERDRGTFKTPTLRNVAATAPYFHDGRFQSLAEVIAWFSEGSHGDLPPLNLTEAEQADLVAFLRALSSDLPPVAKGRLPE